MDTNRAASSPPSAPGSTAPPYIQPTQASGAAFLKRNLPGSILMLNLLRFRDIADYSTAPELAPQTPITGAAAFQLYIEHALPYLRASGGDILLLASGGPYLIGPPSEHWDLVMLVRQTSVASFLAFASNNAYLTGTAHRTAAIQDSRLLPLSEELSF